MSEETNELAALGGSEGAKNEAMDYKAEFEKAQKQLQSERVEAGRLKKANEELAELRKQVAELQSQKRTESALDELDAEIKESMPDDYQRGIAKIAQSTVDQTLKTQIGDRLARLEAKSAEEEQMARNRNKAAFGAHIKQTFPGFIESIQKGGDKQEAWARYQRINAETIAAATDRCDFDTLAYHINNFYSNFLGVPIPSAGQDEAATDPRALSGGYANMDTGNGKYYSATEWQAQLEKAQRDFQSHLIGREKYAQICDELNQAYKQGRVR